MIRTPPSVDQRVRSMMASRTPLQRLRMACRMFATARALGSAGTASFGTDVRVHLFTRMYARDFSDAEIERIVTYLTREPSRKHP